MWLYFHTINHAIQVFFKVSFLGFVDATVMCIIKYCHSNDQRASLESTLQNENAQDMILNSSILYKKADPKSNIAGLKFYDISCCSVKFG